MTEVRFGSININGGVALGDKHQVMSLIKRLKLGIVLLQETHSSLNSHADWRQLLKGQLFFRDKDSMTAGIAFFLHPALQTTQAHR